MQIVIECFNDADLLEGALESIPAEIPVHVFDGRYASFPGDRDTTPRVETITSAFQNTTLYQPTEKLPWGHEYDIDSRYRASKHEQIQYILETIPNDVWTLKLDSDERLKEFAVDVSKLDKNQVYHITALVDETPYTTMPDEKLFVPRLFYPENWSFWVDDVPLPRDEIDRDAPVQKKYQAKRRGKHFPHQNVFHKDKIVVANIGHKRPEEWHEKRSQELEKMYHHLEDVNTHG